MAPQPGCATVLPWGPEGLGEVRKEGGLTTWASPATRAPSEARGLRSAPPTLCTCTPPPLSALQCPAHTPSRQEQMPNPSCPVFTNGPGRDLRHSKTEPFGFINNGTEVRRAEGWQVQGRRGCRWSTHTETHPDTHRHTHRMLAEPVKSAYTLCLVLVLVSWFGQSTVVTQNVTPGEAGLRGNSTSLDFLLQLPMHL